MKCKDCRNLFGVFDAETDRYIWCCNGDEEPAVVKNITGECNLCKEYVLPTGVKLLSAEEARERNQKNIDEELSKIAQKILDAEGRTSVSVDGLLHKGTIERLKELGYKVTVDNEYNFFYCTVSWE